MYVPYSFFYGLWLTVLGILAAPNIIVSRKPEAKEWIDKLVPFQGWMGVISTVWGIIALIRFLTNLQWVKHWPVLAQITTIVYILLFLILGILLGINVMKSFVKDEGAKAKIDDMVSKLAPKQGTFGLIALIVGVWIMLDRLIGIVW
mgnify:CR=1 FL=1